MTLLTATYRLQLRADFPLTAAREVVPYLRRLGVSHVYASPILAARTGSTHGYDVVDPHAVNPELGGEQARRALVDELRAHEMGLLLDVVPNHMGTGPANAAWEDVLAHGRASRYAHWFDVEWEAPEPALRGRVLLPVLGDEPDALLARDELRVVYEDGRFRVAYFDHRFPLDPTTVHRLFAFQHAYDFPDESTRADAEGRSPADALFALRDALIPEGGAELDRDAATRTLEELRALVGRHPALGEYLEWLPRAFSEGENGRYRLGALLDLQNYSLAFWRRAPKEINYRRFFDVNELVALRVEDPEVFRETHALVLEWVSDGSLDGLRIDHVDGLLDPLGYLERLRDEVERRAGPFPIFVEKILSAGEWLRREWPVQGTTGYEFLNDLEALFLDAAGAAEIEGAYRQLLRVRAGGPDFAEVAIRGKLEVLRGALAADVRRLAHLLHPIARRAPEAARLSRTALARGIVELIAALPVYRTYIDDRVPSVREDDGAIVARAVERALARADAPPEALALLGDVLHRGVAGEGNARAERARFIARVQQTSSPATAKGVEDTALYRYVPLASRNEVGGEPDRDLADSPAALHRANAGRAERWPRSLVCTTTHDTKRSADVRARLDVLTEMPREWNGCVARWRRMNRPHYAATGRRPAPDANTEYLLYQTLVGVWPAAVAGGGEPPAAEREALRERVGAYMLKAAREAKMRTSWTDPDEGFERAVDSFVRALVVDEAGASFRDELGQFVGRLARPGFWNALARVLVHLTAPGTPDIYQGDELWNFTLVDPDNRRPVDYAVRRKLLDELEQRAPDGGGNAESLCSELVTAAEDGRIKLLLTQRALGLRRAEPALFRDGGYEPIEADGQAARHVFAFARVHGARAALTVAPRLAATLAGGRAPVGAEAWADTTIRVPPALAERRWRNAITGAGVGSPTAEGALRLAELLRTVPVALLVAE